MSPEAPAAAAAVREWDPPPDRPPQTVARVVLIVTQALAMLVVIYLLSLVVRSWVLPVIALALTVLVIVLEAVPGRVVRKGARPASADEHARSLNLVAGLSKQLGRAEPRLLVSPRHEVNAAVVPRGRVALVLTEPLLESYSRTELEAVIAHCLVRLADSATRWHVYTAARGGMGSRAAPFVGQWVDAQAAALTRYPPALASAIEKATPMTGATAGLWFVAAGPTHLPAEERAVALRDL